MGRGASGNYGASGDMISAVSSDASCKDSRIPENELMEMCYCSKQEEMEGRKYSV